MVAASHRLVTRCTVFYMSQTIDGPDGLRVLTDIEAEPEPLRTELRGLVARLDARPEKPAGSEAPVVRS